MRKWLAVSVLSANLVLHNIQRMAPTPLFDELRVQWNVDYTTVGALYSSYLIAYAVMLSPMGLLADRVDNKKLMMVGTVLNLGASVLFALAPNIAVAMLSRVVLGISGAFLWAPSVRYVVACFDQKSRGQVMGWVQFGAGLGQVLALTLIPAAAVHAGLVAAFLLPAAVSLPLLAGQGLWLQSTLSSGKKLGAVGSLFRTGGFKPHLTFVFLAFLANYAIAGWLPTYLRRDFGFGAVEAGTASSLSAMALMVCSPLAGKLSDWLGARKPVLQAGSALSILCFAIMVFSHNSGLVVLAALMKGAASALTTPIAMMFAGEVFAGAGAGLAVALTSTTGQIASSISGPLFGYTLDATGSFAAVWGVALACTVGSMAFLTPVQERRWAEASPEGGEATLSRP